jgi:hypothetical protein
MGHYNVIAASVVEALATAEVIKRRLADSAAAGRDEPAATDRNAAGIRRT